MSVAQISSLLATLLYENQHYIKGNILFMSNKVYVPHLSKVWVEVSKVCFSPWYLVLSILFVLTYHPCIRSSLHINFTSLAIISPIQNENYVSIRYVTLKAPGWEESISWALHWANWLTTSQQQTTNYIKNNIQCVLICSYHVAHYA